jgi:hypothetical protein
VSEQLTNSVSSSVDLLNVPVGVPASESLHGHHGSEERLGVNEPESQVESDEEYEEEEAESWFNGDSVAFVASLLVHMGLILSLALIPLLNEMESAAVVLVSTPLDPLRDQELVVDDVVYSDISQDQVGAMSSGATEMAEAAAPNLSDVSNIPSPTEMAPQPIANVDLNQVFETASAPLQSPLLRKGKVGEGVTGASGAVDRLTFEILKSMEERPTLVVWLFDESGSLTRQRQEILGRFDKIYEELGIVAESKERRKPGSLSKEPLLTSIISFGKEVHLHTKEPIADLAEIKSIVGSIPEDQSGTERVFSALYSAADKYKALRRSVSRNGPPRNVMLIVVSDERGDDPEGLEPTVNLCRKNGMPVYVVGVPAPFGREHTLVKYVDPDPKYDQSAQWAQVDQGPETLLPERVQIGYSANFQEELTIDSGFGPYALTRLCYETGGIYFTVHPNRNLDRRVRRDEIDPFASRLDRFFDPSVMSRYRPDYVSPEDYMKRVDASPLRRALVNAAKISNIQSLEAPQLRFVKRDDAQFQTELNRAQQAAAILEPRFLQIYSVLKPGEEGRKDETSPRWRAGFDLAMGKLLAAKVRTETYNAMLAKAKRGMVFEKPKNNTWILQPDEEISVGSKHEREADEARKLLKEVSVEHAGTPWALLAQEELDVPVGWKWVESFTDLAPRPQGGANNNNPPAAGKDDEARKLERKAPSRPIPKL